MTKEQTKTNETFSVAAVISNHCVFQRQKNISLFGTAPCGSIISAELFDRKNELLAKNKVLASSSRWLLQLPPLEAHNECTLKITCRTSDTNNNDDGTSPTSTSTGTLLGEKTFTDISIGEIWLAGGQSNMEFELQNCTEGPEELKLKEDPNVRFYYTNKIGWMDEHFYEAEKNTCWQTWNSEYKTAWSAVGYFFAKKLAAELNKAELTANSNQSASITKSADSSSEKITVGIIGCNWGGTSASAWMSRESLEKDTDLKTYLDEQEEATKGKSIQQQCEEYDKYEIENNEWQQKCAEIYSKDPNTEWDEVQKILGPCPWPGPRSCKNPYRPAGLYECMLKRIIPYTLKGVIWYQGESDDHKPRSYAKLFSNMNDVWRTEWHDAHLPFVFVQLPVNRYKQDKDFKHWCLIREAQQKIHDTVKNAWMACCFDLGQYNDIHPKAKKELAERMEKIAWSKVYGNKSKKPAFSPMLQSYIITGNKVQLTFDNAENGFEVHDLLSNERSKMMMEYFKQMEERQGNTVPEHFTGFELAGADGLYYPADFTLSGNKITLTCDKVPAPASARYLWYNYCPAIVYAKNGLPLAPFRTCDDDAAKTTEHAEIQQIMTV